MTKRKRPADSDIPIAGKDTQPSRWWRADIPVPTSADGIVIGRVMLGKDATPVSKRKICEEAAVLKLPDICPNWPKCRAELKTQAAYGLSRFAGRSDVPVGQMALGYFCDCKTKKAVTSKTGDA